MTRNATCPLPDGVEDLHLQGSSHKILIIVSAACTAVTMTSSMVLIAMHLYRYSAPKEQRQIVRIVLAPFIFALVSLAEIANYRIARYIDPISAFYEAICICALFLLYVQSAAPSRGTFGEDLFDAIKAQQEAGSGGKGNWPRNTWVAVFQYPIVELVAIIILEATEATGTYCAASLRPRYGHFWSMIIHSVAMGVAIIAVVRFYGRMKTLMKARRGLVKLGCFKAIVAVRFIQTWIITILIDQNVITPSDRFTYGDLMYGLPNALMCIETVLFAASFWYAFSSTEYAHTSGSQRLPLWRAVLDALNPYDLLHGVVRALKLVTGRQHGNVTVPAHGFAPVMRSGRGRYRTLESPAPVARSHSRTPLQDVPLPESSPPRYEVQPENLSVDTRYDRSRSPSMDRRYGATEESNMV